MAKITEYQEELLRKAIREFFSTQPGVFTDRSIYAMKVNLRESKVEVWSSSSGGSRSFYHPPEFFLDTFSI